MFKFLDSKRSAKVRKQIFSAYKSSDFIREEKGVLGRDFLIFG